MYWTRRLTRNDLEGTTFVHGTTRMNLTSADVAAFVDPTDAALMFGFRALDPGDTFENSFPVWMATLNRRAGADAIVTSLQPVFAQLVDADSLAHLVHGLCDHARSAGYKKVWFDAKIPRLALFAPAIKAVTTKTQRPVEIVPSSGMCALTL
jgi:hypothetical protein